MFCICGYRTFSKYVYTVYLCKLMYTDEAKCEYSLIPENATKKCCKKLEQAI